MGAFTAIIIDNTSATHHAQHNLVLNRPFARANTHFYPVVYLFGITWTPLLCVYPLFQLVLFHLFRFLFDGPCLVSAYVLCTRVLVFIGKDIPGLILLMHKHSVVCCIKSPAIYAYSKIKM